MGKKTDLIEGILLSEDGQEALKPDKVSSPVKKKTQTKEEPSFNELAEGTALTLEEFNNTQTKDKPIRKKKVDVAQFLKKTKTSYRQKEMSSHLQMNRTQFAAKKDSDGSPLQLNLIQSESLRLAQNKIASLEEELEIQRQDNEKLITSGEVLEERVERLTEENEDLRRGKERNKSDFSDEKDVLLTTLEERRRRIEKLEKVKGQLEKRLSRDLQSIRARENSLENRIEIMKLEGGVLQKEKDKAIISLRRDISMMKSSLTASQKKNQELKGQLNDIRESLRKTVSVLRATVNNLEGQQQKEESRIKKTG